MSQKKQFNLLFDFDGTLVDSFDTVIEKLNILAEEFHFRKIQSHEIGDLRKKTSRELIKDLKIPFYKIPRILRAARQLIQNDMLSLLPFNNMLEVLAELQQLDCNLGILTSNSSDNVLMWLTHHELRSFVNFVHTEPRYFGKKYSLKKIINRYQMDLGSTFYIGDQTRDIDAAHQCRIHSIGVSWGFNSEDTLISLKPDYIVRSPSEILTILKEISNDKLHPYHPRYSQ